jgi:hypothetical protein
MTERVLGTGATGPLDGEAPAKPVAVQNVYDDSDEIQPPEDHAEDEDGDE